MDVENEESITGAVTLALRMEAKLTQAKFWAAVGVNQASGCRYERARVKCGIPRPVRILLFLVYVVGLDIDASSEQGTAYLYKLAQAGKHARIGENCAVFHHPV